MSGVRIPHRLPILDAYSNYYFQYSSLFMKPALKIASCICASNSMARISDFQSDHTGSIPVWRSILIYVAIVQRQITEQGKDVEETKHNSVSEVVKSRLQRFYEEAGDRVGGASSAWCRIARVGIM